MPETDDDKFLTRREADLLLERRRNDDRTLGDFHKREHQQEAEALGIALQAARDKQVYHDETFDKAHGAHEGKHGAENEAVRVALESVSRERTIHAAAHEREHTSHQREHELATLAISKAEAATDQRFYAANAYREQINNMVSNLASRESVEVLMKDVDRRFEETRKDTERRHEELRVAVTTLQQTDVKAEGRGIGSSATIAYFVSAVSVLGSIIVLMNLLA